MSDLTFDSCTCGSVVVSSAEAVAEIQAENERLRAALRFYAEKEHYNERLVTASCGCCSHYEDAKIFIDGGSIARAAQPKKDQHK